jgi:hypothetical protein
VQQCIEGATLVACAECASVPLQARSTAQRVARHQTHTSGTHHACAFLKMAVASADDMVPQSAVLEKVQKMPAALTGSDEHPAASHNACSYERAVLLEIPNTRSPVSAIW